MVSIRLKNRNDNERIKTYIKNNWGSEFILAKGIKYSCDDMQGLIAEGDFAVLGICLYVIMNDEIELLFIESFSEGKGVGSSLINEIESIAIEQGIKKIWLITTNDNINAIRFYLKMGFTFKKINRNSIDEYRKIKPEIPIIGFHGIPIMDELEFEKEI